MWPEQVTDLLAPLEDYTRLHSATIRRFGSRVLDLSFPNPRFLTDHRPYQQLAALAASVGPTDLRYSPFGGFTTARRAVAAALSRRHQLWYRWGDIILTPGAAAALAVALQTLFTPPDRIMLVRPCWMDYPLYLAQMRLGCDFVRSTETKGLDLAAIEEAWTPTTRALIISQPASPTGVLHSRADLAALAALLQLLAARYGTLPILIADEAHSDQVWNQVPCPAPATFHTETITVHSFGKAWQMQGQRVGFLAVSPRLTPALQAPQRLAQGMRLSGHCAPTSLMQHLAAALSTNPMKQIADRTGNGELADLHQHTRRALARLGIHVLETQATRFVYARCPTSDDLSLVTALADRGVLTLPSTLFHEPGWFRLALNLSRPDLDRALDIIGEVTAHA